MRASSFTLSIVVWSCSGKGVEVDGDHDAPALHQPPGGDRRVDPAGEERHHAPRGADGEAARPGAALERIEDAVAQHLDEDVDVGRAPGSTRTPVAFCTAAPSARSMSPEFIGNALYDRRAVMRNEVKACSRQRPHDGQRQRIHVEGDATGAGEVRDAEHGGDALPGGLPGRLVGHLDPDPAGQHLHLAAEVLGGPAQVPRELVHEERAVAALEGDLVVARDDEHEGPMTIIVGDDRR